MIKIEDYILLPLSERQAHLKLDEPCIERGGRETTISIYMRGVLSHIFDTTIPIGGKICACHACNNWKCGNYKHIYWGTNRENQLDAVRNGKLSVWEKTIRKYGIEEARQIQKRSACTGGKMKALLRR